MIKLNKKQWIDLIVVEFNRFHDAVIVEQRVSWDRSKGIFIADVYIDLSTCLEDVKEHPFAHLRFSNVKSCKFGVEPNYTDGVIFGMDAWWKWGRIIVDLIDGTGIEDCPSSEQIEKELGYIVCKEIYFERCSVI